MNKEKGEIIIYQPDDNVKLEVRLNEETVWLNRHQMASLFQRDVKTIGKHIANALTEELEGTPVVAKFATTAADGKTYQVEYNTPDWDYMEQYMQKIEKKTKVAINRLVK